MKIGPNYNAQVNQNMEKVLKFLTIFTTGIAAIMVVAAIYFGSIGETNRAVSLVIEAILTVILSFGVYKFAK
jgi:Mg2+ and Co2+ transporter CorA